MGVRNVRRTGSCEPVTQIGPPWSPIIYQNDANRRLATAASALSNPLCPFEHQLTGKPAIPVLHSRGMHFFEMPTRQPTESHMFDNGNYICAIVKRLRWLCSNP